MSYNTLRDHFLMTVYTKNTNWRIQTKREVLTESYISDVLTIGEPVELPVIGETTWYTSSHIAAV